MKDFFKYVTAGEDDRKWGLYLNVVGKSRVPPKTPYPSREHPTGYYFTWNNGRVLNEYQINYITEGAGILETEKGRFLIKPGTMMIIRPGVWHRYRPSSDRGWGENYVGFNGALVKQLLDKIALIQDQSFIRCAIREEYIDTYYKLFDVVLKEKPGFQQVASGMVIMLLGYIISFHKQRHFSGKKIEQVIQEARFQIRENMDDKVDLYKLAENNNIGYSYFRKMFKKYIGVSPHHYHLELKIIRAKELILTTDKSIKEISYELGFQSIHYFSRLFKNKVGINPSELRN
jgi:AraC-like DNA-binding protein